MATTFTVNNISIAGLLGLIEAQQIAIPEIQRPFVWDKTKVRNLIDSLYNGYPIGYLILWQNPNIKTKDGTLAGGKKIIIDGQQRITALMAAIADCEIVDDEYQKVHIKIAFHPVEQKFEVLTPAIRNDKRWIPDISALFRPEFDSFEFIEKYCAANLDIKKNELNKTIIRLKSIENVNVGTIELSSNLEIDTVTEIFIRINSQGKVLSQADFAMSKIASDAKYGGNDLRKAIDYFCHLSVSPTFYEFLKKNDPDFITSTFGSAIRWLKDDNENVFDPDYNDVLRVATLHQFKRGKISDLVSLLSGRDFVTRDYKEEIAEKSFASLRAGIGEFMSEYNFKSFMVAIRSAGFISPHMVTSKMSIDFAYALFLLLRHDDEVTATEIKRVVQKWYVLSVLTGRYISSPESAMDRDIKAIRDKGVRAFIAETEAIELSNSFWELGLPKNLQTVATNSPSYLVYQAAQVFNNDISLLSASTPVRILIENMGDVHHIFPKQYLKVNGIVSRNDYNQVANLAHLDTSVNISIGDRAPSDYFSTARKQCETRVIAVGTILNEEKYRENLDINCIPIDIESMRISQYGSFLEQRRILMAEKIHRFYLSL